MKKNDLFGVKCHPSVQFGIFQSFHDAMLRRSSNLGHKGYFGYKKHWDIIYVRKIIDMP